MQGPSRRPEMLRPALTRALFVQVARRYRYWTIGSLERVGFFSAVNSGESLRPSRLVPVLAFHVGRSLPSGRKRHKPESRFWQHVPPSPTFCSPRILDASRTFCFYLAILFVSSLEHIP